MAPKNNPKYSDRTKGVGAVQQTYESGYGATVNRSPTTSLGALLREARIEQKVSQSAIAKKVGRNVSEISRSETQADHFPRLTNLVAHLNALDMRLAVEKPDGSFVILPLSDFLWADGLPKTHGAKARKK